MVSRVYVADRALHWLIAILLLIMLMGLSTQLHTVDWQVKGQIEHRQDAVSSHATVGALLLSLTIVRLIFTRMFRASIPRLTPRSNKHDLFIKTTHLALNLCIFLLVATGVTMLLNYEIPLSVLGLEFEASKQDFYRVFPDIHAMHMTLKAAVWWLIGIHFVGIMYARK